MNPQPPASADFKLPGQNSHKSLIAAVVFGVLFIAAAVFGYSAYTSVQDYKNNSDQKSAAAVAAAEKVQAAKLQAQFDEQSKSPVRAYTASATNGSVTFNYPKTWSAYVDENGTSQLINAYFHPNQVPGIQSGASFALRVELVTDKFADVVNQFQSSVAAGTVSANAFMPPKLKGVANAQPGMRFDGDILQDGKSQGSMVVIQVRDKTLKIYTQSNDFLADFNNTVLTSLSFAP